MYDAYTRFFTRTGLTFRAVRAHSGAIGGDVSQEFHVLAASGEDAIAFSDEDGYAANLQAAVAAPPAQARPAPQQPLRKAATPGARTIAELARFLKGDPPRCLKTLIVEGRGEQAVALARRADPALNRGKRQSPEARAAP